MGLALEEEQGKSPPAGIPTSPSPRSVEAPQDETQSRERTETTYNLEFQLPHVPKHLHLPVLSEALGMHFNKETFAEAVTPHNIVAHSKVCPVTLQSKRKRVLWEPEENETILKMKKEGCSWEKIHTALSHRIPGAI
ncbi:hypothetical protein BKA65DRAFT_415444 [Rhexocercosporidium sp. MPI-PUGE-AT-0058]|nr:hypothetical protein BKA65DRAFT_415444 [Rhexocercosporidium sp. MPI-PUGE-AT-0058]